MKYFLRASALLLLPLLGACDALGTDPEPRDFAGRWIVTESGTALTLAITCSRSGVLLLEQADASLTGSYDMRGHCVIGGAQGADDMRAGPIERGRVRGATFSFRHGPCNYSTDLPRHADSINGRVACDMRVGGEDHEFLGSWSAARVRVPLLSAGLRPVS